MEKHPYAKYYNLREKQLISQRNFREKWPSFSEKTWSFIGKILKFQGEIQLFPGENDVIILRNFPLFLPEKEAVDHGEIESVP